MTIKVSGRSALILATGLFVCFAGPSRAASGAIAASGSENAAGVPIAVHKNLRHGWHHWKHHAHGRSHTVALKTAGHNKATASAVDVDNASSAAFPDIPPKLADANAQMPFPDVPGVNVRTIQARANELLQGPPGYPADAKAGNETQIVAADQLNDVDRALHQANPPAATSVVASADPPAAPVTAGSQENSTWDETSLIGKIFIGFGALLTMASAARMFMA
jgi:hypothetical protein